MNNIYDYILRLACGNDELRPNLQNPYYVGEHIHATDGKVLLSIPRSLSQLDYSSVKGPESANLIEQAEQEATETLAFKRDELLQVIFRLDMRLNHPTIDCAFCTGYGYYACNCPDCTERHGCEDCDGSGKQDKHSPWAKSTATGSQILINDIISVLPSQIYLLAQIAYFIEENDILAAYQAPNKMIVFKIGQVKAGVMPQRIDMQKDEFICFDCKPPVAL